MKKHSTVFLSGFVAIIAITLRAPSCYESFWLDELHSAWCAWDTLADVGGRANAGHQTPIYFLGLWFWKLIFGESEFALRMSSVIAVSIACGLLTFIISKSFRSHFAGITAGMILAIEENSLFFGTELRPYALIILLSTIAVLCFLSLLRERNLNSKRRTWILLLSTVLLAMIIQPTSVGVLAPLPLMLGIKRRFLHAEKNEHPRKRPMIYLLVAILTFLAVLTLKSSIIESWQNRDLWIAFGKSNSFAQLMAAWNWKWLWLAPALIFSVLLILNGWELSWQQHQITIQIAITLASICVLTTLLYWLLAYPPVAPVWHRRYFIGLLPVFACLGSIPIIFAQQIQTNGKQRQSIHRIFFNPGIWSGFLVIALAWDQNLLHTLTDYPVAYARRGEKWREAVEHINQLASVEDTIWISPGLIEEKLLEQNLSVNLNQPNGRQPDSLTRLEDFLKYPVHGPYRLRFPVQLWKGKRASQMGEPGRDILLVRVPASRLHQSLKSASEVTSFGGLCVLILNKAE